MWSLVRGTRCSRRQLSASQAEMTHERGTYYPLEASCAQSVSEGLEREEDPQLN